MPDTTLPYSTPSDQPLTYGFDIYHGDDDNGPFQFGLALNSQPPRKFFWAKCTEGSDYVDPHYADHIARANLANKNADLDFRPDSTYPAILAGAYHFMSSTAPAKDQIDWFLKHANISKGMLVPLLDVEPDDNGMPSSQLAYQCAQLIKNAIGYWPIIYIDESNYTQLHNGIFRQTFPEHLHTICIAKYSNTPPLVQTAFQQYTETGRLLEENGGSSNNFDLDVYFGTFAELVEKHTIK